MNVKINGETRDLPIGQTVRDIVLLHNLTPEKVAVELNRRLLRGDKYDTPLNDGDEIEIVTFVGGG
ncbi:MAG TPA: sulfur carrier protein ThiS [Humisphaera sp.]|nr:sulfur carrier protein ThiS [Humisphaera sp.]